MLVMSSSFHIKFNELYWNFNTNPSMTTIDSDLVVISYGDRQLYIEPWWRVEGAVGSSGTTPLSIPQGITVSIYRKYQRGDSTELYARLTEVVLPYK